MGPIRVSVGYKLNPSPLDLRDPGEVLDLLPHQIMHSCALGIKDLALGSNMLWDCLTCYQCQEQCPQGVCVTDVFYELKNEAVRVAQEQTREQIGKSI